MGGDSLHPGGVVTERKRLSTCEIVDGEIVQVYGPLVVRLRKVDRQ
jgi:hypothetical protein